MQLGSHGWEKRRQKEEEEEKKGRQGEKSTRKKTKTKRRSHWKLGESTYWYQPELLGTVPSLAAKELWNIFVRAGFLYSPLQAFSDCSLTKRPILWFQPLLPIQKASESSGDLHHWPLSGTFMCYVSLERKVHHTPLTPAESLSLSIPGSRPNFPSPFA